MKETIIICKIQQVLTKLSNFSLIPPLPEQDKALTENVSRTQLKGSLQMLLEKWSTSYLRSTTLKHKPHAAKLKITARNSLQSITPHEEAVLCPWQCARARPGRAAAPARAALASPPVPGTAAAPPHGHSHHRPRPTQAQLTHLTVPELRTQTEQIKNLNLFPQDSPCTVRNSYLRWWVNLNCPLFPHTLPNFWLYSFFYPLVKKCIYLLKKKKKKAKHTSPLTKTSVSHKSKALHAFFPRPAKIN